MERGPNLMRRVPWLALAAAFACGGGDRPPPPLASAGAGQSGSSGVGGSSGGVGGSGSGLGGSSLGGSGGSGIPEPACIPRESCQRYCAAFGNDAPSCGLGNSAQCGCVCEERFNGPCPDELDALVQCMGDGPPIDCGNRGRLIAGCEQQAVALELCDFRAREQLCALAAPRCLAYCTALQLSFCSQGPESVTSCLCGCEASVVERCQSQFDAFMDCSADAPAFGCDSVGRNVPTSCLAQWQALDACLIPDGG